MRPKTDTKENMCNTYGECAIRMIRSGAHRKTVPRDGLVTSLYAVDTLKTNLF